MAPWTLLGNKAMSVCDELDDRKWILVAFKPK